MPRRATIFLAISTLTVIADQLTKWWARALPTDGRGYGIAQPVIDGLFDWRLSFNTGSAFGLFRSAGGARVMLTVVAIAAIAAVVWMLVKARDDQRVFIWAMSLVAGGAVGNVIDRIQFGKVTDFVVLKYHAHEWPTFNVADIALVVGVGLLIVSELRGGERDDPDEQPAPG